MFLNFIQKNNIYFTIFEASPTVKLNYLQNQALECCVSNKLA